MSLSALLRSFTLHTSKRSSLAVSALAPCRTFTASSLTMAIEKVKVASKLDFSKDVEMKEVEFKGDATILLSKVNGDYFATTSKWCVATCPSIHIRRSRYRRPA